MRQVSLVGRSSLGAAYPQPSLHSLLTLLYPLVIYLIDARPSS